MGSQINLLLFLKRLVWLPLLISRTLHKVINHLRSHGLLVLPVVLLLSFTSHQLWDLNYQQLLPQATLLKAFPDQPSTILKWCLLRMVLRVIDLLSYLPLLKLLRHRSHHKWPLTPWFQTHQLLFTGMLSQVLVTSHTLLCTNNQVMLNKLFQLVLKQATRSLLFL